MMRLFSMLLYILKCFHSAQATPGRQPATRTSKMWTPYSLDIVGRMGWLFSFICRNIVMAGVAWMYGLSSNDVRVTINDSFAGEPKNEFV